MRGRKFGNLTRRAVLGGLLAGVGQSVLAGAPEKSLRPVARVGDKAATSVPTAEALISRAALKGNMGFVVADATSGRVLEVRNPLLGFPPASVTKSLTAQYALEALGPAHAFTTRLVATGAVVNGRLEGDLVLVGGGDPTLDTTGLAELAVAMKATGLREVAGRFLVSSGALPHVPRIDPEQPDYLGYNPAVSGLNLNFNRVYFEWKKEQGDWKVTMDARTEEYRPEVKLASMKIVDRKFPVYTYSNGGRVERWTVANRALGKGGSRWLPVRQPELYAGEVFQIFARANGIVLRSAEITREPVRGRTLVDRQSPPLARILKAMLAYSTNLTAEVSGLSASLARGLPADDLAVSAAQMSGWMKARLGMKKPHFVDHSGLSDRSRISASDMVNALLRTGPDSTLASILKPFRIRDGDGNLAPDSGVKLVAKTGTLNFVSGLAGFMQVSEKKTLAFAMFSADLERRAAIPLADRERPPGAKGWNTRAHRMQWGLLNRWATLYGG